MRLNISSAFYFCSFSCAIYSSFSAFYFLILARFSGKKLRYCLRMGFIVGQLQNSNDLLANFGVYGVLYIDLNFVLHFFIIFVLYGIFWFLLCKGYSSNLASYLAKGFKESIRMSPMWFMASYIGQQSVELVSSILEISPAYLYVLLS